MTHKVFNSSNLFGVIAFIALIASGGAAEGEMWLTAIVLLILFAVSVCMSIKENGPIK